MKTRIITKKAECNKNWYFPQYYTKEYFFGLIGGWKYFIEDKGIDTLGFHYGYGEVQFYYKKDALKFIKNENSKQY
jgi:hypothetical protein